MAGAMMKTAMMMTMMMKVSALQKTYRAHIYNSRTSMMTDLTGIELTATEKCQFEKCFGLHPTLFIDGLDYYSWSAKTSFFYPCAMFQKVRQVLAIVMRKVRYLVYHWAC